MSRTRTTTKGFKNKRMDANVYNERRIVIDLIYKAKILLRAAHRIEIPRVDVRITDRENDMTAVGMAKMNGKFIWIPADYLKSKYLYQVVLHELCHTLWGVEHSNDCKLMHPRVQTDLTNAQAEILFMAYAKKHAKA